MAGGSGQSGGWSERVAAAPQFVTDSGSKSHQPARYCCVRARDGRFGRERRSIIAFHSASGRSATLANATEIMFAVMSAALELSPAPARANLKGPGSGSSYKSPWPPQEQPAGCAAERAASKQTPSGPFWGHIFREPFRAGAGTLMEPAARGRLHFIQATPRGRSGASEA